jgi:hypothetical protein
MELIISVDRPSQLDHILESSISFNSKIKRYAITVIRIFKGTLRSTVKIIFQMEAAKVLVGYWHEDALLPPESIRSYRRAWATHSRPIERPRIGPESSSEAMILLDAHQAAADYRLIASTL